MAVLGESVGLWQTNETLIQTQEEIQFDPSSMGNGFVDRTDSITDYDYFVYHTETEIENWSIRMAERFDFVQKKNYGKSIEGRDLYTLIIKEKSGRANVPRHELNYYFNL